MTADEDTPVTLRFPLEGGRSIDLTVPGAWTRGDLEYVRQQLWLILRELDETVPTDTRSYGRGGFLERWCVVEPGE